MSFEQTREYLARVLPWPQAHEEPSYVNVHYTFFPKDGQVKKDGKGKDLLPWAGRAVQSVGGAIKAIDWALKQPSTRDIYVCLSTQRSAIEKTGAKGFKYHTPIRNQANVVALKSLFLDVDIKGGDNGYSCLDEAIGALGNFLAATNLPKPSMIVSSGGGLHIYWTIMRALTKIEWQPLASALAEATKKNGLRCDTQVTIDSARVLRPPGTFNRKTEPPRPVVLANAGRGFDYTIERLATALEPYRTIEAPELPPRAALIGVSDLAAGIDQGKSAPIDLDTVLPECQFLRDAVTLGGKDLTNPLWNLTTLISTFTLGGRTDAHRMGDKHPGYTKESTDEFYDRKVRDRDEKGLGWPSCQTISGNGCKACQACPHFSAGKSPLHLAVRQQPTAVVPQGAQPPLAALLAPLQVHTADLPDTYTRLPNGVVALLVAQEDGTMHPVPICDYRMVEPWLQADAAEGLILHFTSCVNLKVDKKISIPARIVGTQEMTTEFQEQGVMMPIGAKAKENVARFIVAWIKKLQETRESIVTAPFGWSVHKATGLVEGFVFGGELHTPTGAKVSGSPDTVLGRHYAPAGDDKKWRAACAMITAQGRPELEAIVASAFAAPLVRFTGREGVVMSCYSTESGIGKTSSLRVAQSVWGDPIRAVQTLDDTANSVIGKLGQLRALPLYWDELKTEEDVKKFVKLVFQVSGGKEKSRMNRNTEQREPGAWQTLLVACSNDSLLDTVNNHVNTTAAGMLRIVELVVSPPVAGSAGQIDPSDAGRLLASLNDNHGHTGLRYAQWLGEHHEAVDKEVAAYLKALGEEVKTTQDERYWVSLIAVILMGAKYANALGLTQFDEPALKVFMIDLLSKMRATRRTSAVDMSQAINVSVLLQQFFAAMRARHTIRTNRVHVAPGKPPIGSIKVIGDTSRLEGIYVHVGIENKVVRFSNFAFKEWLTEKGYPRHLVVEALQKELGARNVTGRIAGGCGANLVGGTEYLWQIDLAGTPLLDFIDEA